MEHNSRTTRVEEAEAIYRLQAQICRVLGHPRRIQILDLLGDGERSNSDLLRLLGISKVNLSQHLALMRHIGLVESRQQGRETFHRLAILEVEEACRVIRQVVAQRLSQNSRLIRSLRLAGNERAKS